MAGYSARQSSFTTGDTIEAADSNDEFNQILAAFHVSTGHTHDGTTAGDGGPLSTLYSNAISMGTGADTDIVLTFNANTSDGVITWMEDEDYFKFSDDILVNSTEKLQFRDTAIYLYSSADGQLDLVADTEIQIAATTVDINGNVDISGSLTLGGTAITSTAAELNLMDGGTSATSTTVADADRVVYNDAGTMKQVAVTDLDTYISATSKTLTNKTLTSPVLNTGVSGTAVADEDDMSSNSATKLATQQSIKAYVDAQITAEDLDVTTDSGTIAIDLDSETLTIAGGTGLDSSATSNTVTLAIDSTVTTLTGSQTLTNKTLTSPVLNTGVSGTAVLDEDNFASDSATKLATQQSIKAYVDAVSTGITTFVMEDDDGTEVTISNNKEIKYIGSGLTTNWTDTDNGTDGDPYDLTFTVDAAQTGITSILATDLKIGEDNETKIDFETADEIHFYANNTEQVYLADNIFGPQSDSDVDLGTTGVRWKDAYIDTITTTGAISVGGDLTVNGTTTTVNSTTVTIDDPIFTLGGDSAPGSDDNKDRGIEFRYHNGTAAKIGFFGWDDSATAFTFIPDASNSSEVFSGTVGNAVFGNITGTLQTAAQTNITSVGALDGGSITSGFGTIDTGSSNITTTGLISGGSLDIDNVLINGTTIGHTDDTDLMTLSNGGLVVAGTLEATGNITGTLATAAQTNITSLGTLSTLTVDNVIINGTTIGHTDDTDLMTLASGGLTVAGTIEGTTITASTALVPDASGGADLGSTSLEWGDVYIADDKKLYLGSDQNFSIEYDENGNDTTAIVAAGGVSMAPHGTSAGNGTELRFQELAANGANYVGFKAPDAIAANKVFVLPNADGSANQVLKTDGSLALSWVDQAGGGTVSLVADGAITAGKPTILTGAGKAAQVAETTTTASTPTVKSLTTMDDSDTTSVPVNTAYESNSGAFVMVYKDTSGSSYGTAVAGTWSDGTMTWGTPVVFESSAIDDEPQICAGGNRVHVTYRASDGVGGIRSASISGTTLTFAAETTWTTAFQAASGGLDEQAAGQIGRLATAYDTNSNRYLTAYDDAANSNYGTAVVSQLTDANTGAMTWGTPVVFNSASSDLFMQGVAYDSSTSRVLVTYRDASDGYRGHAKVGNITAGTNAVAFGAEATLPNDGNTSYMAAVEDPNTDRVVVFYQDNSDSSKGKATVGTITGGTTNTVAFGTEATFEASASEEVSAAYNPDDNKILVIWGDKTNKLGEAAVGTVTGGTTNTIAFGSPATFDAAGTKGANNSIGGFANCVYDTVGDRFVISYADVDDSYHSKIIGCTVSGTTPSFGTAVKLQADGSGSNHFGIADPTGSAVYVAYTNGGLSNRGYVHKITGTGTTVTDSTTLNWSGTDSSSYVTGAYDEDMARVTIFTHDTGTDLNSLTLLPEDGHQPMAYHVAYDTDNNYVLNVYSSGTTSSVRAISHDTSDGTYTAVGSPSTLYSANMNARRTDILYDTDSNRAVVSYVDSSNSDRPTANVIQTGGTAAAPTVTIGADSVIETDGAQITAMCYDTTNNKVFVAYDNSTDTETKGAIGTITSGTNTIAFTGLAQIRDTGTGDAFDVEFDQIGEKIIHLYRDEDDGNDLTYQVITPGASSFSVSSATEISANDNRLHNGSMSFGASKGILAGLYNADNSSKVSYTSFYYAQTTTSNLTTSNFLGVAAESISDTATGKITINGGINENQSSLTIGTNYFATDAGLVATTGTQLIGKAVAADKIQVGVKSGTVAHNTVALDANAKLPAVDGSQLTSLPTNPSETGGYTFVADGAISAAGKTVSITSDGKAKESYAAITQSLGSNQVILDEPSARFGYNNQATRAAVYDSEAERTVVCYIKSDNKLYAQVLQVNASLYMTAIGTPVEVDGDTTHQHYCVGYDSNTNRVVVFYQDPGNSNYGTAKVGTVTAGTNSISFGSATVFESASSEWINAEFDTNANKFAVIYRDAGNSDYGTAIVGTVTGGTTNTIAFGSATVFESASARYFWGAFFPNRNKIAVFYTDVANSNYLTGTSLTISGTSVTATTPQQMFAQNTQFSSIHYHSATQHGLLTWKNNGQDGRGEAAMVAMDSSGSLSFNGTADITTTDLNHIMSCVNTSTGVGGCVYRDNNDSGKTKFRALTISGGGSTITLSNINEVEGGHGSGSYTESLPDQPNIVYDASTDRFVAYMDVNGDINVGNTGADGNLETKVIRAAAPSNEEDFIGIAQAAVSSGANVDVKVLGQIDSNQTGLVAGTKYYLSGATLTTSGTGNTEIGRAIAADKILITNAG